MILSYILSGNIPYYNPSSQHPDPLLHDKLKDVPHLLNLDLQSLTDHFEASRFSYSTQALPVNSLLDALMRPGGETEDTEEHTCVGWRRVPERAVSHVVFGNARRPGGQWAECSADANWDIQSLSYAGMLSLPGYSFHDHHRRVHGSELPPFTRPSRREISDYLAAYPAAVKIDGSFRSAQCAADITRLDDGFYIGSHQLRCKHLVLASGIFTEPKPARPLLQPLLNLESSSSFSSSIPDSQKSPLLIIGSGFTAADIIISAAPDRRIIHIFKWESEAKPSPLKGCHQQAYPEYAGVYRLMKRAAMAKHAVAEKNAGRVRHPNFRPRTLTPFLKSREWSDIYEGLPNTRVIGVTALGGEAKVTLRLQDGTTLTRQVSGLAYAVGREGSLKYLDRTLRGEVMGQQVSKGNDLVSAETLRTKVLADLEVAKDVFVIGSLTGDSLIRFAYGGCVYAAGKVFSSEQQNTRPIDYRDSTDTGSGEVNRIDATNEPDETQNCSDLSDATTCRESWLGSKRDVRSVDNNAAENKRPRRRSLWPSCFFACR